MKKAYLNWSSGKDSAFALYKIQQEKEYRVEKLVTTVNSEMNRISMHGVRNELLAAQVKSLQLPLQSILLQGNVSMSSYNDVMKTATGILVKEGFTHSIFGDIFLEDLRTYRERQMEEIGISPVFPLWKKNTTELIEDFLDAGFKAIIVCTNAKVLDSSFCGRILNEDFLSDLPSSVDPCGENGEFHTFVFDGPNFSQPVNFEIGEVVEKFYTSEEEDDEICFKDKKQPWDTAFHFCDLHLK